MSSTDEKLNELAADVKTLIRQNAETTTVVRQHIVEQRGVNTRLDRLTSELEARVRETEQRTTRIEERLVEHPVEQKDLQRLEKKVDAIDTDVKGVVKKLAYWSGGVAAVVTVCGFIIKFLLGVL